MGRVKAWMMDREERAAARGAADKYYGRYPEPHMWLDKYRWEVVPKKEMSENEIEAYWKDGEMKKTVKTGDEMVSHMLDEIGNFVWAHWG